MAGGVSVPDPASHLPTNRENHGPLDRTFGGPIYTTYASGCSSTSLIIANMFRFIIILFPFDHNIYKGFKFYVKSIKLHDIDYTRSISKMLW